MDKERKAFWLSILLTGAGQLYLGERKKGWLFLIFSLLGVLMTVAGIVLTIGSSFGLIGPIFELNEVIFAFGIFLLVIGFLLIVILGYRSVRDITSRQKKTKSE